MRKLYLRMYYFIEFLKLWKSLLYGDVSYYHGLPDNSVYLTVRKAMIIAYIVWMR